MKQILIFLANYLIFLTANYGKNFAFTKFPEDDL